MTEVQAALSANAEIVRYRDGIASSVDDEVVIEEPLEIRVRGRAISVTMRTPGHDAELAAGFLLTEGVVRDRADIQKIEVCAKSEFGNTIDVILGPLIHVDFEKLTRHVFAASSCGLCGKTSIEAVRSRHSPIQSDSREVLSPAYFLKLPSVMRQAQATFDRTGGAHAAALFDGNGQMIVLREDIGRHNAVDKVIGHAMLNDRPIRSNDVLLVSGRSSFEIMQKALAARIATVAAVSAPSSLAIDFARENGQTLIGFLRDDRMNVYAGHHRLRQ